MNPTFRSQLVRGVCGAAALVSGCLICASAQAQIGQEQFVIDHLTIRDGLPVNHTNGLIQTEDGYLWINTFGGLVRFDGTRFVTFSAGNTDGIPSDRITGHWLGKGNTFWLTTEQRDVVKVSPGRFDYVGRFEDHPWDVHMDSDSVAWLGTNGGLLKATIDPESHRIRLHHVGDSELAGVPVRNVHRDRNGVLWITHTHKGTPMYNAGAGWRTPDGAADLTSLNIILYEDRRGNLWAGGSRLHRVRPGSVEPLDLPGLPYREDGFQIRWITENRDGELVLLTSHGPYHVSDGRAEPFLQPWTPRRDRTGNNPHAALCPDGRLWTHFDGTIYSDRRPVASITERLSTLFCDRESNLWVTGEGGLYRVRRAGVLTYGEAEGLSVARPTSVYEDRFGGILVTGWVSRFDRILGDRVVTVELPYGTGPFHQDRFGDLWAGTYRCRADWAEPDGLCPRFEQMWPGPGVLPRAIHEDRLGTMWFGIIDGVIWLRNGQWYGLESGHRLDGRMVQQFLETSDGMLYLATAGGGIAVTNPAAEIGEHDRFSYITSQDGLSSDNIRGLYEDFDGTLWIATEDRGLNYYDPESGEISVIRQRDGLYSDGLHQVLADDYGRIWMSSNQGIFWVRREELRAFVEGQLSRLTSIYYRERDGMRVREANGGWQNAAFKARDGRLWFATQGGAAVIDPAQVDEDLPPPTVAIEDLQSGESVMSLAGRNRVRLEADQRTFRVAYTAINFTAPARMRFRYRLRGYDDKWVEAGNRREASFTQVPAGDYELQVWASNGDGLWDAEPAHLNVSVDPFFYETWVFRIMVFVALAGLAWLVVQVRTRALLRRQQELEALVTERTDDLRREKQRTEEQGQQLLKLDRMKTRFFTDISHEFRTPLTLTIGPLEDLREDPAMPESLREGVDLALTNSRRILRLINQLLDVARLEAGEMHLAASEQDVGAYVERVAQQFSPLLERKGIHFDVSLPPKPVQVWFDPDKLEQILANLLSNAFKFTPTGGAIHVGVEVKSDEVRITVRDTGAGIPPEVLPHVFDRFYQVDEAPVAPQGSSGIGLSLVHDLVVLHGGTISVESTPRFGSTFTVMLPLGRDHLADDQIARSPGGTPPGNRHLLEIASLDPVAVDQAEPEPDDRFTVLIADDSADIRAYVRSHMEGRYRILEAADGREALEVVRESTPDLVISDLMMPEMDGLGLLSAMRASPDTDFIPIVILTAKATEEDLLSALERGADAYLTKPFSVRELQVRIDALIKARQRLKQRFAQQRPSRARPQVAPVEEGFSGSDAAFLARVKEVISDHLSDEDFDIQQMADEMRVSRNTVHRRLKAMVDQSPSELLKSARLERAAELLQTHEWNVSEVAYAVGFRSVSYFSHSFKKAYGVTPSGFAGQG